MYFNENSINIIGAQGELFSALKLGGGKKNVSIALPHIQKNSDFLYLWRAGCAAHGISTSAMDIAEEEFPPRVWGAKGVAPLTNSTLKEKPLQNRPPKENDGNYLLDAYINSTSHLKDGGVFRSAPKSYFPDSTEDIQNFVKFLSLPEYRNHPWQSWWYSYLSGEVPSLPSVLGKNLPMLRNSVTVRPGKYVKHPQKGRVHVRERYYILGAPGSALEDAFTNVDANQSCLPEAIRDANRKKIEAEKASKAVEAGESTKKKDKKKKKRRRQSDAAAGDNDEMPKPSSTSSKKHKSNAAVAEDDSDTRSPLAKTSTTPKESSKKSKKRKPDNQEEASQAKKRTKVKKASKTEDEDNEQEREQEKEGLVETVSARPKAKLKRRNTRQPEDWDDVRKGFLTYDS